MKFPQRLLSFRKRRRLSRERLAALLGVSSRTIMLWERAVHAPREFTMVGVLARLKQLSEAKT